MASTIKLKNGSGAPLASDLVAGEPALDLTNKRLYTEDSGGTVIEVGTNPTELQVDNINIDGNAITSTDTDGNIAITPNGTGEVDISKVDIDSGAIDNTVIGGTTTAAGNFTTLQADTSLNVDGTVTADGLTVDGVIDVTSTTSLSTNLQNTGGSALLPTYSFNGSADVGMYCPSVNNLGLVTGQVERIRIDSSGNVGIGVTPDSGWSSSWNALQIGNDASLSCTTDGKSFGRTFLTSNAYNSGTNQATSWNYEGSFHATQYTMQDGNHIWRYAPSGTADAAITWSEAMRIDSSGNLLVGKTTAGDVSINGCELSSSGFGSFSRDGNTAGYFNRDTSDGTIVDFRKDGATVGSIGADGSAPYFATSVGSTLVGIKMQGGSAPRIVPTDGIGDATDNVANIGSATERFKDLYLSGKIEGGSSSAPFRIGHGENISIADDSTIAIQASEAGALFVHAYNKSSGQGAVFFATYSGTVSLVASSGSWATTDSDGNQCCFKSANTHTVAFKNRLGSTAIFRIAVYSAQF